MTKTTLFRRIFISFLSLFLWTVSVQAQTPVKFCVSDATSNNGSVTLAVTTEDFTDILSVQFTAEWNPNDLELITTGNFNSTLNISDFHFTPPSIANPTGLMGFSWVDATFVGQTLPPGAILFSMTFAVNNNATDVIIGNSLAVIEVSNSSGQLVNVETKAGTVNATGSVITGKLFDDTNQDCLLTTGEEGLENWIIKLESSTNTFYASSDIAGNYSAFVPLGDYTISIQDQHESWETCQPSYNVPLNTGGVIVDVDLPVKAAVDCPALEINLESSSLEKCSDDNTYTIEYCNLGTTIATDAYIEITFDEYISVVSSPVPFSDLGNNTFSFDIGDVEMNDCNSFEIVVSVSCDAPEGITHCASAHIFPDTYCTLPDPNWSGASLKITGECDTTNDEVKFTIRNVGTQDMMDNSVYIVIEDVIMMNGFSLDPIPANGTRTITYPANGATYRVEVDQVPLHPGNSMPSATVEGCGTGINGISTGIVNQYPQDEGDRFIAIDCRENTSVNIANSKEATPTGYSSENFIEPNTDIEYLIRFQNTGTDDLVDMAVRDTLSQFLDATSVRAIASSHPYIFEINGEGVVTFKFANINLTANESGFVKFKISQVPDLALGTVIANTSAIHFGFNSTISTNTVFHTINENFIDVKTEWVSIPNLAVNVYPNPSRDVVHFEVKGYDFETIELKLFDMRGSVIHTATSPNELFTFHGNDVPAGVYAFSLSSGGALLSTGKLIIK